MGQEKTIICLLKVTIFQPFPSSKGQAYHRTLWSEPSYYRTFRLGGLSTLTDYHDDILVTGGLVGPHEAVCLLRSLALTHLLLWVWYIAVAFRAQAGTTLRTICRAWGGNEVPYMDAYKDNWNRWCTSCRCSFMYWMCASCIFNIYGCFFI